MAPKKRGGMGFRNYEVFNQALLAKQAWRLATKPESQCSRVLRARYFKGGDFLTAKYPKTASFTWKSILHGRELLKEGLIWRIGNGESINVWETNWIPREGLKRPLGHKPDAVITNVSEVIDTDSRSWNESKLHELFFDGDVEDILKIPVGRAGTDDYIAWNYTKNGVFSVKSAYHLKMQLKQNAAGLPASSRSVDEHKGWLALWAANVPGKAKIHIWRLIKNGLAVGEELKRRKIKDGVKCVACNRDESLLHRFWRCPHSISAWATLKSLTGLELCSPNATATRPRELQGWVLDWLGRLDDRELSLCIMLIYQLWLARNDARDEEAIEDPRGVARRALYLVDEWAGLKNGEPCDEQRVVEHWLPPEEGWHKANADGAFASESGHGGSGVVLRDHHGAFVAGKCCLFTYVPDAERAELLACRSALVLAKGMRISKVCLESDCLGAVSKLRGCDKDRSVHGPLVEEIKDLLKGFDDHSVRHARRSCNGVAHMLAKSGCENKSCNTSVGSPPEWVVNILASDCAV